MFQNCLNLLSCYSWKPIEKLIDCRAGLEIFEKRLYRHASSFEDRLTIEAYSRRTSLISASTFCSESRKSASQRSWSGIFATRCGGEMKSTSRDFKDS